MSQIWLIASGKGGTGKTLVTAALGCALSRRGYSVCMVDACFGMRCLDMTLGMQNQVLFDISDLLSGGCQTSDALLTFGDRPGLYFLPASQHEEESLYSSELLHSLLTRLKQRAAYVLIDMPAGIGDTARRWFPLADQTILVTTPDEMAMRCTEQMSSLMRKNGAISQMLLVNRLREDFAASGMCYTPQIISDVLDLPLLGYLPEDSYLEKKLLTDCYPDLSECPFSYAANRICKRILGEETPMPSLKKKRGLRV